MPPARCLRYITSRLDTISIHLPTRAFHTTIPTLAAPLPPRRPILDSEITENFLKGSGPGGQKINKTSSAVQLIHHPTGIVVKYQDTRSRELNRKRARRILQDRLEELELGENARTRVKAREKSKKKASSGKKSRRKYRALEEAKNGGTGGETGETGEAGEEAEMDGSRTDEAEIGEVDRQTAQSRPAQDDGPSRAAGE